MPFFHLYHKPDPLECYDILKTILHGKDFGCPNGHGIEVSTIHKKDRWPVVVHKCKECGKTYNIYTATVFQGTKYSAVQLVLIFNLLSHGFTPERVAADLEIDLLGLKRNLTKFLEFLKTVDLIPPGPLKNIYKFLHDIESWESFPDPVRPGKTAIVLKYKFGKYYRLAHRVYYHSTTRGGKRHSTEYTHIYEMSAKEYEKYRQNPDDEKYLLLT